MVEVDDSSGPEMGSDGLFYAKVFVVVSLALSWHILPLAKQPLTKQSESV